jgi:hypothetical protein
LAREDAAEEPLAPHLQQREPARDRAARATPAVAAIARPDLGEIGEVVRDLLDEILDAYVERLRNDPATPRARRMRRPELEDHSLTLLSDIAQTLLIMAKAGHDAPKLLRDGSVIQHAIADHHGRRRRAQGWTETAVHRDHQLLREEIERAVRARLRGRGSAAGAEEGIQLVLQLVQHAEGVSANAWRHADDETSEPATPPAPGR